MHNNSDNNGVAVPYFVYEGEMARNERKEKRLVLIVLILISLLFLSNALWLYEWSQYDYESTSKTVTLEGEDGVVNYIGEDGDITNGEDKSKSDSYHQK